MDAGRREADQQHPPCWRRPRNPRPWSRERGKRPAGQPPGQARGARRRRWQAVRCGDRRRHRVRGRDRWRADARQAFGAGVCSDQDCRFALGNRCATPGGRRHPRGGRRSSNCLTQQVVVACRSECDMNSSGSVSPRHLTLPSHAALLAGRAASGLSRRFGKGRGSQVGGKLAYRLWPHTLDDLARGRHTLLVSATNGKSTTATLAAAAIGTLGTTAFNATGANMEEGLVVALDVDRSAPNAVLETDEAYLDVVVRAARPHAITLM